MGRPGNDHVVGHPSRRTRPPRRRSRNHREPPPSRCGQRRRDTTAARFVDVVGGPQVPHHRRLRCVGNDVPTRRVCATRRTTTTTCLRRSFLVQDGIGTQRCWWRWWGTQAVDGNVGDFGGGAVAAGQHANARRYPRAVAGREQEQVHRQGQPRAGPGSCNGVHQARQRARRQPQLLGVPRPRRHPRTVQRRRGAWGDGRETDPGGVGGGEPDWHQTWDWRVGARLRCIRSQLLASGREADRRAVDDADDFRARGCDWHRVPRG